MKNALKKKALTNNRVPQCREDAVVAIGRIGTLRREIAAHKARADEAARLAGEKLEADTAELMAELADHERGVQAWCEANRQALTVDGKVKFHDFGTGQVKWRARPAGVSIRGAEAVIAACKSFGFSMFIRVKEEINKEAMLADPEKARVIAGVTIKSAGEDFVIEPTEIDAPSAMSA